MPDPRNRLAQNPAKAARVPTVQNLAAQKANLAPNESQNKKPPSSPMELEGSPAMVQIFEKVTSR